MAPGNSTRAQRISYHTVSNALSSAAAEWILMLLLFVDGFFSFLVTKYAQYFKIQKPCLFCSRLDHILGHEKPGFYKDLICHAHKLEISSSAYCHVHEKLADVQDMCEDCLFSFATEKKSNSETYKSLVGKLEGNLVITEEPHREQLASIYPDGLKVNSEEEEVVQGPLLSHQKLDPPIAKYCSCCNVPFNNKHRVHRLLQTKLLEVEGHQELGVVLFGQSHDNSLHSEDGSDKVREKSLGVTDLPHIKDQNVGPLAHIEYTELKGTSDSESEPVFSDKNDGADPLGISDVKEEMLSQSLEQESFLDSDVCVEQKHQSSVFTLTKSSCLLPLEKTQPVEHHDDDMLPQNLEQKTYSDSKGQNAIQKAPEMQICSSPTLNESSCLLPVEFEHHDGDTLVPKTTIEQVDVLTQNEYKEKCQTSSTSGHVSEIPGSNLDDTQTPHVENSVAITEESTFLDKDISEVSDLKLVEVGTSDPAVICPAINVEESKNSNSMDMGLRPIQMSGDPISLMHSHMDLNDAYRLAISCKINQPSPRDSYRVHEDLRSLLSQLSATRGLEFPWSDITPSPRLYGQGDDLKMSDSSSTASQQNLHKRLSIERNESGIESLDGSIVSEIEGESPVDRLRRQVDLDKKSMSLLYKELEEEKNASAIAVNQAMAMITRLQEEKAAMQMEALQYQRMMEEQAEYDQEALQKLNDLLTQKEEELQDLKAEMGNYKKCPENVSSPTKRKGDLKQKEDIICRPLVKLSDDKKITEQNNAFFLDGDKVATPEKPMLSFEDEKLYISQCLKKLESKLHLFSNNGFHADISNSYIIDDSLPVHVVGNGHLHEDNTLEVRNLEEESGQLEEDSMLSQMSLSFVSENMKLNGQLTNRKKNADILEVPGSGAENQQSSMIIRRAELLDVENELLQLNYRLETLEADRSFLEHTMNSLRCGDDGIRLVREIANHLNDLRHIGVRRKEQTTT